MNNGISRFAVLTLVATTTSWIWMPTALSMELASNATANCNASTVPATAKYRGVKYNTGTQTRLRISNGGGKHCSSPCKYRLTEGPYQLGSLVLLARWLVLTLIGPGNLGGKLKTTSCGRFNFILRRVILTYP